MTTSTPASEYEESCRRDMPGGVGPIFCELRHNVIYIRAVQTFLFELSFNDEAAQLLHDTAPIFATVLHESLLREGLLAAARLTDPVFSGNRGDRANLSFPRLLHELRAAGDTEFADKLEPWISELTEDVLEVHKVRNKVLAHADLATAIDQPPPAIPAPTKEGFEALVRDFVRILNLVETRYLRSNTDYSGDSALRDTQLLLHALRQSREADRRPTALSEGARHHWHCD